jgi:hypothetical protein
MRALKIADCGLPIADFKSAIRNPQSAIKSHDSPLTTHHTMHIEFHGLAFDTPQVTAHLWTPWRATALEHKLFEAVRDQVHAEVEQLPDECRLRISDPRAFKSAVQAVARVLKGWQEEADPHSERRSWWWLMEGDTDANGYDHNGDPTALWCLLRVAIDRGGPGEAEKGEDFDLEGFSIKIWSQNT